MAKKKVDIVHASLGLRLSSHEKICQVRMENILKSIERLEKKVSDLSESVNKGKGVVSVLVFLGSIVAAAIGIFNYK
tara:strand:+ start:922 stop:1152 length:231 start_codon:yes stop_codon:yes gene_type:complete